MTVPRLAALISAQWVLCGLVQICIHKMCVQSIIERSDVLFVQSFSLQNARWHRRTMPSYSRNGARARGGVWVKAVGDGKSEKGGRARMRAASTASNKSATFTGNATGIDVTGIDEAQLLLACRSWLLRKHKVEWKEKKRRKEAAASPLNNEGYFWPDPNDLLYLREDPDPYNLNYNETYGEYYGYKRNGVRFLQSTDTTYSGKNYLVDETDSPVEERASLSTNPFSTNPLYPSDEHVRRSNAKKRLFNNSTWKEEWYRRRWKGKVTTPSQKKQRKTNNLLRDIPIHVLESSSFDSMSEEDVAEAIITYLTANQRKSESRLSNKDNRQIERQLFREWREQVKQEARNAPKDGNITTTMKDIAMKVVPPTSNGEVLSFSPPENVMKKLRKKRSEKSRMAFQQRLANSKANATPSNKMKFRRRNYDEDDDDDARGDYISGNDEPRREVSPVQALLQIDEALDNNKLPSPIDVETILKPGRLGRRRDILRRILSEGFDLRGKCVPSLSGEGGPNLLFVTKCTVDELGHFVLEKLTQENR